MHEFRRPKTSKKKDPLQITRLFELTGDGEKIQCNICQLIFKSTNDRGLDKHMCKLPTKPIELPAYLSPNLYFRSDNRLKGSKLQEVYENSLKQRLLKVVLVELTSVSENFEPYIK